VQISLKHNPNVIQSIMRVRAYTLKHLISGSKLDLMVSILKLSYLLVLWNPQDCKLAILKKRIL